MDGGGGEQQSEWKTGRGNGEKSKKHRLPLKMNVSVLLCFAAKL